MSGHETMPCVAHTKQYQVCSGKKARRVSITHTRGLDRQSVVQYSSRCVGFQKPYRHVVDQKRPLLK